MASDITLKFNGDKVGLVVRGKLSAAHEPGNMEQHADCILPDGAPVGFFGEGDGDKLNSIGMSMKGAVYDHKELLIHRKPYVDFKTAIAYNVISTVLAIAVDKKQADLFKKYWSKLDKSPGTFNILGGNCSTHASESFVYAGILKNGIPGLDTPNNLYKQLVKVHGASTKSYSGNVGFNANAKGGGFDVVIRPYIASPAVPAPNQSSSSF